MAYTNERKRFPSDDELIDWFYYYSLVMPKNANYIDAVSKTELPFYQLENKGQFKWLQKSEDDIYDKLAMRVLGYLDEAERYWKISYENFISEHYSDAVERRVNQLDFSTSM